MNIWPLKFRDVGNERLLFTDDAGGFFEGSREFLNRYINDAINDEDRDFLSDNGHAFESEADLAHSAFLYRWASRLNRPECLSYLILVPTLRCNLECSYCQVSRVNETAAGFDWTNDTVKAVLRLLGTMEVQDPTIEFQGGEPLLRLDLLGVVRDFCREHFGAPKFVVCTNLQRVDNASWEFLSSSDTLISTSFDGTSELHTNQRTHSDVATQTFKKNFARVIQEFGPSRISALPTLSPTAPPLPEDVVRNFANMGLHSIFLRPINYQGFARKRHDVRRASEVWNTYYESFIEYLITYNATALEPVEEFYFSHCLRRVLQPGHNGHTDLRNPTIFGSDFLVVDHDGKLYPTDEARMVTRVGQIDLSIGDVFAGLNQERVAELNAGGLNILDPDCRHCVFQPYCGLDPIDDISRYDRADLPRGETEHCQRHLAIFDLVFKLLYREDEHTRNSIAIWADLPEFVPSIAPRIT